MSVALDYEPIVRKLLDKSQEGKIAWEKDYDPYGQPRPGHLVCGLQENRFEIVQVEDTYVLRMKDSEGDVIFQVDAQDEIVFDDPKKREMFTLLYDLFELARRKALAVDQKLADFQPSWTRPRFAGSYPVHNPPKRSFLARILAQDDAAQAGEFIRVDGLDSATAAVRREGENMVEVRASNEGILQANRLARRTEVNE